MKKLPLIEERCPRCDYSLAGSPDDYHCPECGFEYTSREFQVFGRPSPHFVQNIVGWSLVLVLMIFLASRSSGISMRIMLAIYVVVIVRGIWRWRNRRNMGDRVALWRGGMIILLDDREPQWLSWREIGTIRRSFWGWLFVIESPSGAKLATVTTHCLGYGSAPKKFIAAAEEWLDRYRAEHPEEGA